MRDAGGVMDAVERAPPHAVPEIRSRWHWLGRAAAGGVPRCATPPPPPKRRRPPGVATANAALGTSIAYDRSGEYLYEYIDPLGGLHDPVALEEISKYMIDATGSQEDRSLYSNWNPGVNF